jgi:hypothetical protein
VKIDDKGVEDPRSNRTSNKSYMTPSFQQRSRLESADVEVECPIGTETNFDPEYYGMYDPETF